MAALRSNSWTLAVVVGLVGAWMFATSEQARSYPDGEPQFTKWEYTSVGTEATSLPVRLSELGEQGWEVFSIDRSDMVLEMGDGNTHLVASRYEVSAKRPVRP